MATDCQGTLDELNRFLDQELSAELRADILDHLQNCTDCQQTFDFHGELKRVVRQKVQSEEMPGTLLEKIASCFGDDWVD